MEDLNASETNADEEVENLNEIETKDDVEVENLNALETKSLQLCAPEYGRLITIHAGKPKGHAKDYLSVAGDVRRLSLSEQMIQNISESHGTKIVRQLPNLLQNFFYHF